MEDLFSGSDDNKYYCSQKNATRNVSSIELEKLLCANGSFVCCKKKNKYKESGHYWQPYPKGEVVIQRCQNKGCMCKPVIDGKRRCQSHNIQTQSGNEMLYNPSNESQMRRGTANSIVKAQGQSGTEVNGSFEIINKESDHNISTDQEIANNNQIRKQSGSNETHNNPNGMYNEQRGVYKGNHRTSNDPYSIPTDQEEINSKNGASNEVQSYRASNDRNEIPGDLELRNNDEIQNNSYAAPADYKIQPVPNTENDYAISEQQSKYRRKSMNAKAPEFPMCKPNPCDPCPDDLRYCMPSNFKDLIQEAGDREITYTECANRDRCTCDNFEGQEDLRTSLKLPGKICIQSLEQPILNETPVEKETIQEYVAEPKASSSKQTCCFCFKKKTKKCNDKCVQTDEDPTNKIIQKEEESPCCVCPVRGQDEANVVVEPVHDKVKSIWICSRCGKLYNSTCKRCDKSSTRNTFIIPPTTAALSGEQTETLRTLIKLEAKQNYRQIDNILLELNEQRNEIKKLQKIYYTISNDVNPIGSIKSDKLNGVQETQNVYICEGCEIDINRNILRSIKNKDKRNLICDINWDNIYQIAENNKYLKNITNRRKCPINIRKNQNKNIDNINIQDTNFKKDSINNKTVKKLITTNIETKHLLEKDIQTEDGKYVRHDITKLKRNNRENEIKNQKKENSFYDTDSYDKKGTNLEDDKLEAEKPYIEELNTTGSETQLNERSFAAWWKRSITNLRQKKKMDILKHHCLQRKISGCKKSSLQEKPTENATQYNNPEELNEKKGYLLNKIVQCQVKDKEVKTKRSFMESCASYCK